jgi:hypothetical protein
MAASRKRAAIFRARLGSAQERREGRDRPDARAAGDEDEGKHRAGRDIAMMFQEIVHQEPHLFQDEASADMVNKFLVEM